MEVRQYYKCWQFLQIWNISCINHKKIRGNNKLTKCKNSYLIRPHNTEHLKELF